MGTCEVALFEPCQEAILEEVRSVGVVIGARRIDEHVADACVSVNVRLPRMAEEGFKRPCRYPVVWLRYMYAQSHIGAPITAEVAGRKPARYEHKAIDPLPLLSEQLCGECPERESDHRIGVRMLAGGPAGDLFDGVVSDAACEGETLVEPPKDRSGVHVGRVDLVARRAKTRSQSAQALGETLSVMKEDDFGDMFSVRLSGALRQSALVPR